MTNELVMVLIGGSLGAVGRFALTGWINERTSRSFPIATFLINLSGSFLLGVLLSFQTEHLTYLLLGTGFLGGFTTFSTFQMESVALIRLKQRKTMLCYFGLTFCSCILLAFFGIWLGSLIQ
jgi:CrcB protein